MQLFSIQIQRKIHKMMTTWENRRRRLENGDHFCYNGREKDAEANYVEGEDRTHSSQTKQRARL